MCGFRGVYVSFVYKSIGIHCSRLHVLYLLSHASTHSHTNTHTQCGFERDLAYQLVCQTKGPMRVSKNYVFGMVSTLFKHLKTVKRPVIPLQVSMLFPGAVTFV